MHNVEVEILFISMNYRLQRPEDLGGKKLKIRCSLVTECLNPYKGQSMLCRRFERTASWVRVFTIELISTSWLHLVVATGLRVTASSPVAVCTVCHHQLTIRNTAAVKPFLSRHKRK